MFLLADKKLNYFLEILFVTFPFPTLHFPCELQFYLMAIIIQNIYF